jgi:hypothetical protein
MPPVPESPRARARSHAQPRVELGVEAFAPAEPAEPPEPVEPASGTSASGIASLGHAPIHPARSAIWQRRLEGKPSGRDIAVQLK